MKRLSAVVWLKLTAWWHGLRSGAGKTDAAVAIVLSLLGAAFSVALAFGIGAVVHLALLEGDADARRVGLLIAFWVMGFLGVILPMFFGLGQPAVPLSRLAVFPFSRGSLYRITLAASLVSSFHFLWYPSLLAVGLSVIILHGTGAVFGGAVLLLFAVCLVIWCNTVLQALQRLMGRRSLRELAALIGLILLVGASLMPAVFESRGLEPEASWLRLPEGVASVVGRVASAFPPSLATDAMEAVFLGDVGYSLRSLGWMGLWMVAGIAIGYRILARSLLEGTTSQRSRGTTSVSPGSESPGLLSMDRLGGSPAPVRGIASKEIRYLVRSTVGKFNIVIMPFFVLVVGALVARDVTGTVLGLDRPSLIFIGAMVYASMFSNNFLYNSFAWERDGVRSYFISPVPPEQIVLGKNLGVWIYNSILGVECVIAFAIVVGLPPLPAFLSGCLAFAAALLASTTVGNFVSITMPVPRDIAKITNSPSQTGILLSLGMLVVNASLIGGLVAIPALVGMTWLQPLLLSILLLLLVLLYRMLRRPTARLMLERCEGLVETLQVAP